jgi:hypothetical protein
MGFLSLERSRHDRHFFDAAMKGSRRATIMMLSSAGRRGDAARCRQRGIRAYLVRPLKRSELLPRSPSSSGTRPLKCHQCRSRGLRRSRRVGITEGLIYRVLLLAPVKCLECGARYSVFGRGLGFERRGEYRLLAHYLGLRGRARRAFQIWAIGILLSVAVLAGTVFLMVRLNRTPDAGDPGSAAENDQLPEIRPGDRIREQPTM